MMTVQIERFADNFSSRHLFGEGLLVKPGFLLCVDLDGRLRHCANAFYKIYSVTIPHLCLVGNNETVECVVPLLPGAA